MTPLVHTLGVRANPPSRSDDHARYLAAESWVRDWLKANVKSACVRAGMWLVASWILDRTRPTYRSHGHPRECGRLRRRNARIHWVVFRAKACADETLLPARTLKRTLDRLIEAGLVECYREKDRPPTPMGHEHKKRWYGPNTQIVRVKYELFGRHVEGGK
jgi:hypothetical protein